MTWAGEGGREWQEVDLALHPGGSGKFFSFPPSEEQSPAHKWELTLVWSRLRGTVSCAYIRHAALVRSTL